MKTPGGGTPREDYEILCEDAAREIVEFMECKRDVSFEDSQADFWGEDDDGWDWQATMVLSMEYRDRVYRIPVFCQDDSGQVEFGESDMPWGDTERDLWRIIWISEVDATTDLQKQEPK